MGWQETLDDYAHAMSPTKADRLLGVGTGTVAAAIRRGEIEPYRIPSAPTRPRVTPRMLAEWLERHCKGDAREGGEADGGREGPWLA